MLASQKKKKKQLIRGPGTAVPVQCGDVSIHNNNTFFSIKRHCTTCFRLAPRSLLTKTYCQHYLRWNELDWHNFTNGRAFLLLSNQETSGHIKEAGADRSLDVWRFWLSASHVNTSPLKDCGRSCSRSTTWRHHCLCKSNYNHFFWTFAWITYDRRCGLG